MEPERSPGTRSGERRRRTLECAAVLASGAAHALWTGFFGAEGYAVGVIGGGWVTYLIARAVADRTAIWKWGFRREGLGGASLATAAVLVLGAGATVGLAAQRGTLHDNVHMLPLLAVYPLWGWMQQLLMFGVFLENLRVLWPQSRHAAAIAMTICAFGLVHAPAWPLVAATIALAAALTPIWLRWRNLWPLGVCHGWLAVLFYYEVLGRDAWARVFR